MPVNTSHILIIDGEYLIAMDAELILTRALDCHVTICTPNDYERVLAENRFDLALVDAGDALAKFAMLFEAVRVRCATIVITTAYEEYSSGVPGAFGYPVVLKPYDEDALIKAITGSALRNAAGAHGPAPLDTSSGPRDAKKSMTGFRFGEISVH